METIQKLQLLAENAALEPAEEVGRSGRVAPCGQTPAAMKGLGVTMAALPGGKRRPLLKTMLTSACERDCHYCPFRAGRNMRRTTFKPEEMAGTIRRLYDAGVIEGVFLSSGIIGGSVRTQDKLLDTIAILREREAFRGFVHLKLMPGAETAQIERAMHLADRLSVNLEAPTPARLAKLAPMKHLYQELVRPLQVVEHIRRTQAPLPGRRWPSTVTQFVVGAAGDTDVELLATSERLYRQARLGRVYYSAFRPVEDTPLEGLPATPLQRQNRLYQASFLLRDYNFTMEELAFDEAGNLPLGVDPKLALAERELAEAPVELNRAPREQLLRVPGIGPKSALAIERARRRGILRELRDLQAIGVGTKRPAPYVLLNGRRPVYQPRLFNI